MEKLNKNCICCFNPFKDPCKFTYCYDCNQLPKETNKCDSDTKKGTQCKLKALQANNNKCYYHKSKNNEIKFIDE